MTSPTVMVAVNLGASGGRVMVGIASPGQLDLRELHRFPNVPVTVLGTLHWDILALFQGVLDGVRAAAGAADVASLGIDAWGVDYGLLDASGALLGNPVHYRDTRTEGVAARVLAQVPAAELYEITGVQHLPFNTIFQLAAAAGTPQLASAHTLLMIPDLLAFWLTGQAGAEVTSAFDHPALRCAGAGMVHVGDDPRRHPAGHLPAAEAPRRHHREPAVGAQRRGRACRARARAGRRLA